MKKLFFLASLAALPVLFAQNHRVEGVDLTKPLADEWTSYSGDYSGKRFSLLDKINVNTVKNLSLEWLNMNIRAGCGPTGVSAGNPSEGSGAGRGFGGPAGPMIVSGLGDGAANPCGSARLQGGILVANGVIYAASSYNVYAIDAHDGQVLWHHYWKARPGPNLGTRGLAMWRNYIYFAEHDDWLVCLDARRSGKKRLPRSPKTTGYRTRRW